MATSGLRTSGVAEGLQEIARIDWSVPWLKDWAAWGQAIAADALAQAGGSAHPVADALNRARRQQRPGLSIEFVAQEGLPQGMAYEAFIRQEGAVPTRDNAHDFFNGLAWLHTPHIKIRLNELQAAEIAAMGVGSRRGPVRDAITVLDENGAILLAPPAIWQALKQREWPRLFGVLRPLWAQCHLWPLGHALPEKLIAPRKAIVAHVLALESLDGAAIATWADLDAHVARHLTGPWLSLKPFCALPVLGVPGWCADNETPEFYADTGVFRPPRT